MQVRDWSIEFPVASADLEVLRAALAVAAGEMLSFWDAVLLVTAGQAGCAFLLSEDMQDGGRFAGVTVLNPFVGDALSRAGRGAARLITMSRRGAARPR